MKYENVERLGSQIGSDFLKALCEEEGVTSQNARYNYLLKLSDAVRKAAIDRLWEEANRTEVLKS